MGAKGSVTIGLLWDMAVLRKREGVMIGFSPGFCYYCYTNL